MPTLEETVDRYAELVAEYEETVAAGGDTAAIEEEVESYLGKVEEKIDAVASYLLTLERRAEVCDEDSAKLKARAASLRRSRSWLASVTARAMARMGWKKLNGARATITRVPGRTSVVVTDSERIPDELVECSFTVQARGTYIEALRDIVSRIAYEHEGAVGPVTRKPVKDAIKSWLERDPASIAGARLALGDDGLRAYISNSKKVSQEEE